MTQNEKKLNELFNELVPISGKAATVAGEIVRAICRIGYRNYNDGDHVGVGYGKETCNAPARYLIDNTDDTVATVVCNLWGVKNDERYDTMLDALEAAVLKFIEEHTELKTTENRKDMWDYQDDREDRDDEGDEDDGSW